jgi:hypothetical protein
MLTGLFLGQCLARMETMWVCYCCLQAKRKKEKGTFRVQMSKIKSVSDWTHHGVQEYWDSMNLYHFIENQSCVSELGTSLCLSSHVLRH